MAAHLPIMPQANLYPEIYQSCLKSTHHLLWLESRWMEKHVHLAKRLVSPPSSHISAAVQLGRLRKKMAAHPRTRHAKQILLVSHSFSHLHFSPLFILLHSSSPKFCLLRNAESVARVRGDWASDIDGLEQAMWLTGDAAKILHIFYPLIQSGRD